MAMGAAQARHSAPQWHLHSSAPAARLAPVLACWLVCSPAIWSVVVLLAAQPSAVLSALDLPILNAFSGSLPQQRRALLQATCELLFTLA